MSKAHINSQLVLTNNTIAVDNRSLLLDHCRSTDLCTTNGQYALNTGYPSPIDPTTITIGTGPGKSSYGFYGTTGGIRYMLTQVPNTIFMYFQSIDTTTISSRGLFGLYSQVGTTPNYVNAYVYGYNGTDSNRGNVVLDVYMHDGTYATTAVTFTCSIPVTSVNVLDGNWHSISVQMYVPYQSSYTFVLNVDGKYTANANSTGTYVDSNTHILPSEMFVGFYPCTNTKGNLSCGHISSSEIRADLGTFTNDEITSWHINRGAFWDPLDYAAYAY